MRYIRFWSWLFYYVIIIDYKQLIGSRVYMIVIFRTVTENLQFTIIQETKNLFLSLDTFQIHCKRIDNIIIQDHYPILVFD